MSKYLNLLFIAFVFFLCSHATAQTEIEQKALSSQKLEKLSADITNVLQRENLVGAAVALVNKDGVFWTKGFGYADRKAGLQVTPDTLFRAGSTGKSITSIIAMRLVEEGRLDLNATLSDIAPEIKFTNKWKDEAPVRLVHLLEHTTGWDDFHFSEYRSVAEGTTLAEGLAVNPQSRTSRWPPGRYASYCNSGTAVMGYILEKVTGEKFETLAHRYVFQPLGIRSATFNQTDKDFSRLAKSYGLTGAVIENTRIWASSAGAWAISARDLGRLVQLYIRRGEVDGIKLISPAGIDRIEHPKTTLAAKNGLSLGYGLGSYKMIGWENKDIYQGHEGGLNGFQAVYAYRKDAGFGYVILTNSQNMKGPAHIRRLILNYLSELSPAKNSSDLSPDTNIENYGGLYQAFTPRQENARMFIEMLGVMSVQKDGDYLSMKNIFGGQAVKLAAFGQGRFAPLGVSEADRIFYRNESGQYELALGFDLQNSAFRKVDPLRAYGPLIIYAFFIINAVIAFLFTCIWAVGRLFGKFKHTNRWRVWTFPMLSILVFLVGNIIAVIATAMNPNFYEILGTANLATRAIQLSGLLMPVLAVIAVFMLFRTQNVSGWVRWHAGIATVSILLLSALMIYYNQIGLSFWAYTPLTYERYIGF